jgi:undecaprenyl-diphosphatase
VQPTLIAFPIQSLLARLSDYRAPGEVRVFQALNLGPHPWLDSVMILVTGRPFEIIAATLVSLSLIVRFGRRALSAVTLAWLAVGISDLLAYRLWKPLFARVRPCYTLPTGSYRQLVFAENSGSMPSSHASNSFAFALVVSLCYPPLAPVALPLAALIAVSRVFVGVHWPTDVLAGAVWGALVALSVLPLRRPLARLLERKS